MTATFKNANRLPETAFSRKPLGQPLAEGLAEAWSLSRSIHGNEFIAHIPGMFVVNGRRGRYRAVSITGDRCDLSCDHCKGKLLETMAHAPDPDSLQRIAFEARDRGDVGMLISGGCDSSGRLPWRDFIPAIARLAEETGLTVTVHPGQVDRQTAVALKDAGVSQALVDVIGHDETVRQVYHLEEGVSAIRRTMDNLAAAGLEMVPHVLFGLHYGRQLGEESALEMLKGYPLKKYVAVVIMPFRGTPMEGVQAPPPEQVAGFLVKARKELPELWACLGCARPRGHYRKTLDVLAVQAGINAIALPAEAAVDKARWSGLDVRTEEACCSLGKPRSYEHPYDSSRSL